MSILEQISEHGYRHLRGAVPNSDWTGIEENAVWISDKQYRYPNKDGSKSEHYRSLGTTLKLTADGKDWQLWVKRVRERLKENGFTTMSYVRDPLKSEPYEPHDMRCILDDFHFYERITVRKLMAEQQATWDQYDKADDREAMSCLLNSLDPTLRKSVEKESDSELTFVTLFWNVMSKIQTRSPEYYQTLKEKILKRRIAHYQNENVAAMCLQLRQELEELDNANRFDYEMLPKLLKAFQEAGGGDRNYLLDLEAKSVTLKNTLKLANLKTREQVIEDCKNAKCYWQDILDCARDSYDPLAATGTWLPTQKMNDRSGLRSSYGANLAGGDINPEANNLTQIQGSFTYDKPKPKRDMSKDNCNHCGKVGHWARDCPEKKQRGGSGRGGNRTNQGRSSGNGRGNGGRGGGDGKRAPNPTPNPKKHKTEKPWKKTKPKPGESETKVVDGVTWYWCKLCNRWVRSHGTADHKKKDGNSGPQANMAAGGDGLALDPQIWMAKMMFCEPCDEDAAPLPELKSEIEPIEPTRCTFCEMLGHDISYCGTFKLSHCPFTGPSLPKGCTWCGLYGHSKPNCASVHVMDPDTKKAARQLERHVSIKASIKPRQTQQELQAIKMVQRNQKVHKVWEDRLAARALKAKREKDHWDSLPILETPPKVETPKSLSWFCFRRNAQVVAHHPHHGGNILG